MLLLAVLLGSVSLLAAQTPGPPPLDYTFTAELYSEGDHNAMGMGILTCSIMSPLSPSVASDLSRVEILHNNEVYIADTTGTVAAQRHIFRVAPIGRNTEYTVNLAIVELSQADAGMYTCRAYGNSDTLLAEAHLQFDVNYLPDLSYPTCSILGSRSSGEPIQHGESVTLLCSSKSGKPAVQLEWQEGSGIEFKSVLKTESKKYVQSEVTLDAIYTSRGGLKFTCISRSEAFPDYRGSCTVGPLNIAPPSDEDTTGMMGTDAQQTTLATESINRGTASGGSAVRTSSAVECNPLYNGNDFAWIIAVVVLSILLCISTIFNIHCATRRKRRAKTVPRTNNQESESNYQGLNNSTVTQGPYTTLNTPKISLKTVTKKSTIVNYTEATTGEEDYAQVDNPQSPRQLEDTVERYRKLPGKCDDAYVNLNIRPLKPR